MKNFILTLLASFLILSCTIVNSTEFSKDNSGDMSVYIDMSEFVKKMGKMKKKNKKDLDFSAKQNKNLDSLTLIEYLKQVEGLSEVKAIKNNKEYKYGVAFHFDSPTSLNEAANRIEHFTKVEKDSTATLGTYSYYNFSKKSLELKEPLEKSEKSEDKKEAVIGSDKMGEMVAMEWHIAFTKRKIKKVISDLDVKKNGKKQVIINAKGTQLTDRKSETIVVVKF